LSCHHGHQWETTADLTGLELVCRRCGAVTSVKDPGDTREAQPVDVTVDTNNPGGNGSNANAERDRFGASECTPEEDAEASVFITVDYAPSAAPENPSDLSNEARRLTGISHPPMPPEEFQPPKLAGYEVLEEIGRGGMGVVYRARDKSFGREVALKTLQNMSPDNLHRFKGEFRTLADIAHPNLASLYELLSDGETWCFSMEILEGVEFLEYIWSGFESLGSSGEKNRFSVAATDRARLTSERMERLEDVMKQLAIGLNALHDAGVLHSDIKPSNVLVTTEGRLVLLDFGLSAPIARRKRDSKLVQGTPRYMSPEQASASRLTEASDWYAVGVMLYEVLTGRLPFRGKTMEILSRKQIEPPVDPAQLRSDNPQHLNDLCVALLDRSPQNRPSAADVLRCFGMPDLADDMLSIRRAVAKQSIELVGRERHFEILRKSFARVAGGETLSTFVHGKSGMGKSVLIRSFLDGIHSRNEAVILEGRCYEQESVPFKALDSLIDSLAVYLESLSEDNIHSVMPRDRLALTRVFPVLGAVPEVKNATYPSIENADQQELRQRAMNALHELLQRLAIREPLILYVDDLQWGDVDSAGLLADLVRPPDAPRMLLLVSYRSEDVENSACLKAVTDAFKTGEQLPTREELSIDSLTEDESTQLALMLLGKDDETHLAYAKKIAQESSGWPFFVWEMAQHLQVDPEIADQTFELDEVIWSRVKRLPPETLRMLELIAVVGRPMASTEVYQALEAVAKGPTLLAQLRAGNFIRTTETEDEETVVETYHDRIRESVFNHLDDAQIKEHNLNLALTIEAVSGIHVDDLQAHINRSAEFEEPEFPLELEKHVWQRVFDLAYFFDAAGEPERAFPFALVAAEQTRSQNALEVSEQQYRIADRGAASVAEPIRFRVAEGLGDVLMLRGKYDAGRAQLETAGSIAVSDMASARIDGKLGDLIFKSGDIGNAAQYLENGLRTLGDPPPGNAISRFAKLAKEGVIQLLHSYSPSRFVGRHALDTEQCRKDMLRIRIYGRLTLTYWFTSGMVPTLWSHLRQMNLAERYPATKELSRTYAFHAITMTGIPNAKRGIAYAERAYKIGGDLGDLWGQGQSRSYQSFSYAVLAQFQNAVESSREAVQLLEQAGDVWEANMARMIGTMGTYHLGDLRTALSETKRAFTIGTETGDYSAIAISMWIWTQIQPASAPAEVIETEFERPRKDPLTKALAIQARGFELLLRDDRPQEAADVLKQSLDLAKQRSIRNVCVFRGVSWNATALRIVAEREPEGPSRKRALKEAKKAVNDALKITKSYLNSRPHALRERALISVLESRDAQARHYFEESLRVAEEHEARYEHALSLLACGEAGQEFGWPDAADQIARSRSEIDSIEEYDA